MYGPFKKFNLDYPSIKLFVHLPQKLTPDESVMKVTHAKVTKVTVPGDSPFTLPCHTTTKAERHLCVYANEGFGC